MSGLLSREVVSEISVLNDGGSKTALVVYQPGFSSFPKDASYAFAEGLALSGWRVEITTASPKAPVDLSKYTLLTLIYPVYGGTAGTALSAPAPGSRPGLPLRDVRASGIPRCRVPRTG